jgi:hypothetical protein
VGLLHGDLDASPSTNAPLTRAGLEACADGGLDAWVLGHLHHPRLLELAGGRWALYPGSLQPRDWTEEGPHGAWIVELADRRLGRPEPVPLATVRWETVEADLSGAEDVDEAAARAAVALREAADELGESGPGAPEWLLLRLELTGRCAVPRHALERAAEEIVSGEGFAAGDGQARVAQVVVATRPAVDLVDVARGDGPPALLADLLLRLEGGGTPDPETADLLDLLARVGRRVEEVHALRPYAALGDSLPDPEARREHLTGHLEAAARSLLEGFLSQKVQKIQKAGAG